MKETKARKRLSFGKYAWAICALTTAAPAIFAVNTGLWPDETWHLQFVMSRSVLTTI